MSCPVCNSRLENENDQTGGRDASFYSCPRCGDFVLSRTLVAELPGILERDKSAWAKISHALCSMHQANKEPEINSRTVKAILQRPLPSPKEQADLFVRWLGQNLEGPGEKLLVGPITHGGIIGAKSPEGFEFIFRYLKDSEIIDGNPNKTLQGLGTTPVSLTFKGWDYYEDLRFIGKTYRKAFIAMKFDDPDLNQILNNVLRPCVAQTGFNLVRLDDFPKAGLIDDRLRVEIRSADFLIADLTHDNPGAYWEAGFAEGLGKPVIFICEKCKFDDKKTHFDTNHHLTIRWDRDNPQIAGEELKATIRATLPQYAKQVDD